MAVTTPTPIKSGDHVLLCLADEEPQLVETWAAALQVAFPGVKFTFVSGVTGALVLGRGDAHD